MKKDSTFKFVSKIVALCGIVYVATRIVSGQFGFEVAGVAVFTLALLVI